MISACAFALWITTSRILMYADDIVIATQHANKTTLKQNLTQELEVLVEYFGKWRLTPSVLKLPPKLSRSHPPL